jgi:hypothetical protein
MQDMVGAIAVLLIFGGPLAAWIVWRVLAHQERIEMIRRGYIPPPDFPPPWGRRYRRDFGGWTPPGAMPPPGAQPPQRNSWCSPPSAPGAYEYYAQNQLRKGITLTMIGFALLIGLSFIGPLNGIFFFGPWMLGGLIPMFVGIAQIINAVLNGARIPGTWGSSVSWTPPPQPDGSSPFGSAPGPSSATPPPPAGPYGWRPDSTPEIPKPTQPPDRRP